MTKVKICGITNLDDALIAVDAGADMLGFNFYKKSPRFVSPASVKAIISKVPRRITTVGVFVDESVDFIAKTIESTGIDVIQLHGDESTLFVDELRKRIQSDVIKAFRVSDNFEVADTLDYPVHGVMLDAFSPSERGGTGEIFDWAIARSVWTMVGQLWLAGGLTFANVGDAIREVRPYAVDVCSGVESAKGIKDPAKIRAFVKNAKNAL